MSQLDGGNSFIEKKMKNNINETRTLSIVKNSAISDVMILSN